MRSLLDLRYNAYSWKFLKKKVSGKKNKVSSYVILKRKFLVEKLNQERRYNSQSRININQEELKILLIVPFDLKAISHKCR